MLKGFDPLSPEFRLNPYPYYAFLRQGMPVFYMADWNMWFCTRYEDCVSLMRDPRLGHEILRVKTLDDMGWTANEDLPNNYAVLNRIQRRWMLFRDPPDHTRLRGLVHKAFTPRMVEKLRGFIETVTADLLDKAQTHREMDIVTDLAIPLPVIVIAEMLGVPQADQETFRQWSTALAGTLDLTGGERRIWDAAADAAVEFDHYFRDLTAKRRADPQDDLLSALIHAEEEGDSLTEDELISTCILLLIAGHETTVNLIGNGMKALLENPAQHALLKNDPDLIKSAIEEMLRYDSPVQMTSRFVLEPLEVDGNQIRVGHQVAVMFAAANRDPERFPEPDTFDITRENNKHMAFGNGIHFCLGAPLARLEAQIAIGEVVRRMPAMQINTETFEYRKTYILRGLTSLPVTF